MTDHSAVAFDLITSIPKLPPFKRHLYNYNKANFDAFNDLLPRTSWNFLNSVTDLNSAWSQWKNIFIQVADASIPKVRWRKRKLKHWFSPLTIKLIRRKRKIYLRLLRQPSPALSDKYRKISNLVRSKTREDTRSYVESLSKLSSTNPKLFWRWINTSKMNRSIIPPVHHNGNVIYDDTAKARIFNDHFCSVFTNESDFEDVTELSKCLHHYPLLASSLTFTEEEVYNELKALNPLKACGPDGVPLLLLHKSAEHISFPLSILFNKSLSTGQLPLDWVSANVIPVHKKSDKSIPINYRPISLTSIIVKVLERLLCHRLVPLLEDSGRLNDYQYGFRPKRSTVTLLLEVVHSWAQTLERRSSTHCLFLDFSKAFDSVPHGRLLLKLESLGIRGNLLRWFHSFITYRF